MPEKKEQQLQGPSLDSLLTPLSSSKSKKKEKPVITHSPNITAGDVTDAFDIDDLLPESFKRVLQADNKMGSGAEAKEEEDEGTSGQEEDLDNILKTNSDSQEEPQDTPEIQSQEDIQEDDEDDLDLSHENIEALLEGEMDAVKKKKPLQASEDDKDYFWKEDEDYKKLLTQLSYTNMSQEEIDSFIKKVVDKKVVDHSTYVRGLQEEKENIERQYEMFSSEFERLKSIERSLLFDQSEKVKNEYAKPMNHAALEIKSILELEGATDISIQKLLMASNKTEFNNLIKHHNFEDASLTKLTNEWRNYKELFTKYSADRRAAQENLAQVLNSGLSEDVSKKVLQNGLLDIAKAGEQYKYIHDAILEGVEKYPDAGEVIFQGKNTFNTLLQALSNPSEYLHSEPWLNALAKYTLNAAHTAHVARKHQEQEKEYHTMKNDLKRLVKEYIALRDSAVGISGKKKGIPFKRVNGKDVDSSEQAFQEYQAFLKQDISIDDILKG